MEEVKLQSSLISTADLPHKLTNEEGMQETREEEIEMQTKLPGWTGSRGTLVYDCWWEPSRSIYCSNITSVESTIIDPTAKENVS